MNSDWQNFLSEQDTTQYTGQQTVFCDLSQFGTLRVAGEDAQSFLQNLLSNDIREVTAAQAQISSFNSAKGRMLATFLIWRDGEDYLLQLPASLLEAMKKKLSMYVLRAKVKITDNSNNLISLGIFGESAQTLLPEGAGELALRGVMQATEMSVIRLGEQQFMLNTTPEHAPARWQILTQQAMPVACAHWDWINIRAGMPVILQQTQEQFVPQMVNFELIGGINFKKGCYPGQEIVARMHYLGKPKRRMYLAHLESNVAPQPGDEIYSAAELACGMIANVAAAPRGGFDALVVMQIESHDAQSVHLKSLQGAPLQFEALPYPLP